MLELIYLYYLKNSMNEFEKFIFKRANYIFKLKWLVMSR